jgi:hypothetical protein
MNLYIHSLIRLHGVVLNQLSTGTTVPFLFKSLSVIGVCPLNMNIYFTKIMALQMSPESRKTISLKGLEKSD